MNLKKLRAFYNSYHQKNDVYSKPISDTNFTYYYFIKYFNTHFKGAYSKTTKVLDVGCGVGSISFYLASKGLSVVGIDISSRAINVCNAVRKATGLDATHFKKQVLDGTVEKNTIVVCSEIIEHIHDDVKFVSYLNKKVKKNGYLFLSTPSKETVFYSLGFFAQFDAEVGHVRRYTKEGLQTLLESQGFKIEALYPIEGILRNILFTTRLGYCIKYIRGPLVPLFHYVDMIFIFLFGPCNYFVVARKK